MKLLDIVLIGLVAAVSATIGILVFDIVREQNNTYHITCWDGGSVIYESEASNLHRGDTYIKFDDEDGRHQFLVNMNCHVETNVDRSKQ